MPFYEQFPAVLLDMADTLKYTYHVQKIYVHTRARARSHTHTHTYIWQTHWNTHTM